MDYQISRNLLMSRLDIAIKDDVSESLYNKITNVVNSVPTLCQTQSNWLVVHYLEPYPANEDTFTEHHVVKSCRCCLHEYDGEGNFCPLCGSDNSSPAVHVYKLLEKSK